MGPTASGKTGVAVELAQRLPIELISVDSALVYRDMNIGTAKPDAATLARAPHHLIDIISPTGAYSAAAFCTDALRLMHEITQRGKIPMLVGGTMLYFKALREGLSDLPKSDPAIRAALNDEIEKFGIEHLYRQLERVDAETAARLKPTDMQRIQRALEVYQISGKSLSELIRQSPLDKGEQVAGGRNGATGEIPYKIISIALIPSNRAQLHARIETRFKAMLAQGLLDELSGLREKYLLQPDMTSMRCVGYRQAWQFMAGEINATQLLETGLAATRQLAKRQLTWLRSTPTDIEVDCLAPELTQTIAENLSVVVHSC
jgi:tRNA dimethylallyltransferase